MSESFHMEWKSEYFAVYVEVLKNGERVSITFRKAPPTVFFPNFQYALRYVKQLNEETKRLFDALLKMQEKAKKIREVME